MKCPLQAAECFEKALESSSLDLELRASCHFNLGTAYELQLKVDLALENYSTAIAINPNHYDVYVQKASLLFVHKRDVLAAIADLSFAIQIDPTRAEAYLSLANCYLSLNNCCKALESMDLAMVITPDNPGGYFTRGQIYLNLRNPQQALVDFEKSLLLGLQDGPVYLLKGDAHMELEEFQRALTCYRQAIRIPNFTHEAWERIQEVVIKLGYVRLREI